MHYSAYQTGKLFFETYVSKMSAPRVVEIGSQNVNGALREVQSSNVQEYVGIDFVSGDGVDVVLTDPYKYPLPSESFDVLVTSSCFEHSEMFWLSYIEGMRLLKPNGLMYINVPSAWMSYHRYPVDCWRFWPDAAKGLESWSKYNGYDSMVLESYVSSPSQGELFTDYVCVILKERAHQDTYPVRMVDGLRAGVDYFNAFRFPSNEEFPNGWETPKAQILQDVIWVENGQLRFR